MTASEASYIGLAKQTQKGTPNVTDADFQYILFREGSMAPNNLFVPLDQEVGGGAMLRSIIKAGVMSAGQFDFIPRPDSLGNFLLGALGDDTVSGAGPSYTHTFALPTDQFAAPYFTVRAAPGNLWGETFQDVRVAGLSLNWKAADYVRGQLALVGGLPTPNVVMTGWAPSAKVDGGPQFIAPVSDIEIPTATDVKVLSGAVAMQMNIPMDEQWITGSYHPDDFDINSRVFTITLALKITSAALYNKMTYDPANGAAWLASIYKEADIKLLFNSDQNAGTGIPYSLSFKGNGLAAATGNANIAWTITPIALRAGRQVIATVTGTILGYSAAAPVQAILINTHQAEY
jgi:hypothetical protein